MKRIVSLLMVVLLAVAPVYAAAELFVWFLDVGQGDCTVVQCDGETMVIDGGPGGASQVVYTFLRETLGVSGIDYAVLTHPHEDHAGGLTAVFSAAPVELMLSPVTAWRTKVVSRLLDYTELSGTPVTVPAAGDMLPLDSAVVTVLHCWPEAAEWRTEGENDMSIVVRIDYGGTSFIITGDAEEASEYMMIDAGVPLKADVLRVAHHGSYTATSKEFLAKVSPQYAVISCGEGNPYGHPHGSVLNRLKKAGVKLFRTDLQGTVSCVSDGKRITFSAERAADDRQLYQAPARLDTAGR